MIKGVVFEDLPGAHDDERRTLAPVFNGDLPGFKGAAQLKIASMKKEAALGKHYHHYAELFTILGGTALFALTNPEGGATECYELVPGKRLLIPAGVRHEATVTAGAALIGLTEEAYVSPAHNDHRD